MGQEIRDLIYQPGSSKWASIDVFQAFRDKRQDNIDGIHYKSWIISMRLSQGTYRWARALVPNPRLGSYIRHQNRRKSEILRKRNRK